MPFNWHRTVSRKYSRRQSYPCWLGQRQIYRPRNSQHLQANITTRTRFRSLGFGVLVPNKADTWTRMVYAGPNKPIPPIDDPIRYLTNYTATSRTERTWKVFLTKFVVISPNLQIAYLSRTVSFLRNTRKWSDDLNVN